jgi:ketosteroid isomerase-like protein
VDLAGLTDDFEFDASGRVFDPIVCHGHEEVVAFFERLGEIWERQELAPSDFLVAGDQVVVSVRVTAVGKESGVETSAHGGHLWTFRGDQASGLRIFQSRAEALRAAGLSE